LNRVCKFS